MAISTRSKKLMIKSKIKNTYVLGLFDTPSLFTKNKLKEGVVALRITFVWNAGEIEDRVKIFTEFLFPKIAYQ